MRPLRAALVALTLFAGTAAGTAASPLDQCSGFFGWFFTCEASSNGTRTTCDGDRYGLDCTTRPGLGAGYSAPSVQTRCDTSLFGDSLSCTSRGPGFFGPSRTFDVPLSTCRSIDYWC